MNDNLEEYNMNNFKTLAAVAAAILTVSGAHAVDNDAATTSPMKQAAVTKTMTKQPVAKAVKASDIIGMDVKNMQNESIGEVKDVIVHLGAGRVVGVVVSTGGFLGLGDTLSVVPPSKLKATADGNDLMMDATKETLTNAPRFTANEWPDVGSPAYIKEVNKAYRVNDSFDWGMETDSSDAKNKIDRDDDDSNHANKTAKAHDNDVSPLDQSNAPGDVEITRNIRKALMDREGLSTGAKNVRIITANGRVVLNGEVANAAEKKTVNDAAVAVAGADKVDNRLTVDTDD